MGLNRGRGDKLGAHQRYTKSLGSPQLTPPKFRRQLKTTTLVQDVPADFKFPTGFEGDQHFIQLKQDPNETPTATLTTIEEQLLTGDPLLSYTRTKEAQLESITEQLVDEDEPPPALTARMVEMDQEAIGDGHSILRVGTVPTLFTDVKLSVEIPDPIPEKFRVTVPRRTDSTLVDGTATQPNLAAGELARTEDQVNVFTKRSTVSYRDITILPVSLIDYKLTEQKQIEEITATLDNGLQTLSPTARTVEAAVENLGNNTSLKTVGVVPSLFTDQKYSKSIPDPVPEKFRIAIPKLTFSTLVDGTASEPTLGTGELEKSEDQINVFTKRTTLTSRDPASLPVSLTDYRMTNEKQLETIIATLATGLQTLSLDELTIEAAVENLGNNTSLKSVGTVPTLFPRDSYTTSILNLIPEKMRATIQLSKSSYDEPGQPSTNPTLLTGEFERTESRVNEFVRRIEITELGSVVVPVVLTDFGLTEKFGGAVTQTVWTLHNHGVLSLDTGVAVIDSDLQDLGNGYDLRRTESSLAGGWPANSGQDYDERLNVILPYVEQVKAAGANLGDPQTEIKPIDFWRQQNRTIDLTAIRAVLSAYVLQYPGTVNIDLPDKLVSVDGIIETSFGEGADDETGSFAHTGSYSVSMALQAQAQSSATMIPDAIPGIKQFWGNNLPATHYHFFLESPVTSADVLTALAALVGSPINAWPTFQPEQVTIVGIGKRTSLQVKAHSQGSAAESSGGSSSTTGGGTGYSREKTLTIKTIRVSPTIHAEIDVGGVTSGTQPISATATAEATGLGPAETETQADSADASITPTTIAATAGSTDWPSSGIYLLRTDAQPYRFGFVQFHCLVVDASGFPS